MDATLTRFVAPAAALATGIAFTANWLTVNVLGTSVGVGPTVGGWGTTWAVLLFVVAGVGFVSELFIGTMSTAYTTAAVSVGALIYTGNVFYNYESMSSVEKMFVHTNFAFYAAFVGLLVTLAASVHTVFTGE